MSVGCRVIVFAKAPRAGHAKTRLAPALGAEGAARLAARLLAHTVEQALAAGLGEVELCTDPDPSHPAFSALAGRVQFSTQGDGDLGERMQRALDRALGAGPRALLIGTDVPALDAAYLRQAAAALDGADAVFGPVADGGYVLVGLRRRLPTLFADMPWSTAHVMAVSRERLAASGVRHAELALLHDVDEPADLVHVPPGWLAAAKADAPTPAAAADALLDGLRKTLWAAGGPWANAPLQPLADKGLAHHHVRIAGSGLIARLPKQSQMGLAAQANLDYEQACFERAAASGHVPRLAGTLAIGPHLPRGGLLVDEVAGRAARLPDDLPAIASALAALHALPLPAPAQRTPLLDAADPLADLRHEIEAQAQHLDAAGLTPAARSAIERLRSGLQRCCEAMPRPPRRLIAFDAHPGNFLLRDDGSAVLVDLEKARYSHAPLDLAHATLYTSTTWDIASHAELSAAQVAAFYATWEAHCGDQQRPWYLPLRAAMWLWSLTWCAKWRVLSQHAAAGNNGEDWSQQHSDGPLVAHVRERVDCYLGGPAIARGLDELATLQRLWGD